MVSLAYTAHNHFNRSQGQVQEIVAIAINATCKSVLLTQKNYIGPVND